MTKHGHDSNIMQGLTLQVLQFNFFSNLVISLHRKMIPQLNVMDYYIWILLLAKTQKCWCDKDYISGLFAKSYILLFKTAFEFRVRE